MGPADVEQAHFPPDEGETCWFAVCSMVYVCFSSRRHTLKWMPHSPSTEVHAKAQTCEAACWGSHDTHVALRTTTACIAFAVSQGLPIAWRMLTHVSSQKLHEVWNTVISTKDKESEKSTVHSHAFGKWYSPCFIKHSITCLSSILQAFNECVRVSFWYIALGQWVLATC